MQQHPSFQSHIGIFFNESLVKSQRTTTNFKKTNITETTFSDNIQILKTPK